MLLGLFGLYDYICGGRCFVQNDIAELKDLGMFLSGERVGPEWFQSGS